MVVSSSHRRRSQKKTRCCGVITSAIQSTNNQFVYFLRDEAHKKYNIKLQKQDKYKQNKSKAELYFTGYFQEMFLENYLRRLRRFAATSQLLLEEPYVMCI